MDNETYRKGNDFTDRQWKVIRFALWHFSSAARERFNDQQEQPR